MQNLMAQAQRVQKEITKKREELDNTTFEGKSEWVTVTLNGKKELLKYTLTYNEPITEDDKEMLEDMTKIALKEAYNAIDKKFEETMGAYSSLGGLF